MFDFVQDYNTCASVAKEYPWFEQFHELMSSRQSSGPVRLVTSSPYDQSQRQPSLPSASQSLPSASQSSTTGTEEPMDEDVVYSQSRPVAGLDEIAAQSQHDPRSRRVISTSSTSSSVQTATPSPFVTIPGSTPTRNPTASTSRHRSASAAFGADGDADSDSALLTSASPSPRKLQSSPSKNKRVEVPDVVRAATADQLQARIKVEEERTKREEMRLSFQREESERKDRRKREEGERQERIFKQQEQSRSEERRMMMQMMQSMQALVTRVAPTPAPPQFNFGDMLADIAGQEEERPDDSQN